MTDANKSGGKPFEESISIKKKNKRIGNGYNKSLFEKIKTSI